MPTLQSVVASGALAAWTVPDHVGTWAWPSSSQTGCSVMGSGPPLPQLVCFSCMVVWGLDAGSPLCPVAPHQGERGLLTSRSQPLHWLPGERDPTHEPCRQAQTLVTRHGHCSEPPAPSLVGISDRRPRRRGPLTRRVFTPRLAGGGRRRPDGRGQVPALQVGVRGSPVQRPGPPGAAAAPGRCGPARVCPGSGTCGWH